MDEHPLLRALSSVDAALDEVTELDPAFLPTGDKARALLRISRELARLEGLRLESLTAAVDVAEDRGARSAGVWLAGEVQAGAAAGARDQLLAEALARWPGVGTALREGRLNPAQAAVVVRALDALPADLDAELAGKAEAQLVADAGHFGPPRAAGAGASGARGGGSVGGRARGGAAAPGRGGPRPSRAAGLVPATR